MNRTPDKEKATWFELFTEIVGWLQIFASPFLIGLIIAAIVYFPKPTTTKLVIAIIIASAGLCTGIIWATRVWRKKGTNHFMSGLMATPELDPRDSPSHVNESRRDSLFRDGS